MIDTTTIFAAALDAQQRGRMNDAARLYGEILALDPRHALAWHQAGLLAFFARQYETAFGRLSRAILLDGRNATFHHNMGACCRALGRLDDARASYQQALRIDPTLDLARAHLCFTLYGLGRTREAEQLTAETLARPRTTAEMHAICGTLLLLRGQWQEGWRENEWRLELPEHRWRVPRENMWDGSPLAGRTLLICAEQGLGDTLLLARYAALVRERGGQPILAAQRALVPLLSAANLCQVVCQDDPLPRYDVHISMFSLPRVFATQVDTVPANVPYLHAKQTLVEHWGAKLSAYPGVRVGILWQGSVEYQFDRVRSFPLGELAPLAAVAGVRLISLQKGYGREQLAAPRSFEVVDPDAELDAEHGPFMDTAAVIANLDVVVTCDSALGHLAGALGAKVWLAQPTMCDWRWMLDRDDSPWYPRTRLFRQTRPGDWNGVMERMAVELRALTAKS